MNTNLSWFNYLNILIIKIFLKIKSIKLKILIIYFCKLFMQYFHLLWETPVFPLGIAALRRRNPGEKMVAGSIPLKGHFWEHLNRLLNFWYWSDEFEKQTRTRKAISTGRGYPYPVHRTPTDDPIYGGGNGQGEGK